MGESLGDLIATLGSIDDDEIDWQNVRQTTVLIQQSFAYEYPGPIASLRHRLMVVPPDYHDDQRLVTHKLRVSGCNIDTERSYDTFGNVVLDLSIEQVEREVEFTTWAVVERETAVNGADTPDAVTFDQRFAEPSRLTRPDDRLRAVAIDPTHDRRAGLRYLTVAVGRDYCDVPPTSGTYDAPYSGELTTHKRAAVTRVEYVRPPRRRRPGPVRTA